MVIVNILALGLVAHRICRTLNHRSNIASDPAGILTILGCLMAGEARRLNVMQFCITFVFINQEILP
ncbi:hypothetical protein [Mesorhizobium prunaredense]|nr:hypothetical protein [Mesorhizobium prunaredense]